LRKDTVKAVLFTAGGTGVGKAIGACEDVYNNDYEGILNRCTSGKTALQLVKRAMTQVRSLSPGRFRQNLIRK